jgi:Transcriptional regulators of sugar metabolism
MLPVARREQILDYVKNRKNATSEELSKRFNVTEETIRKDLNYLSEKGTIIRTFGGAMVKDEYDPSLEQRTISNYEEKRLIAEAASLLIKERDTIILDAGSTTIELAKYIKEDSEVVVVTNSLEIINILSRIQGISVISTGGQLRPKSMSFQGQLAESSIGNYNIQKAFISAKAVGVNEGIMDTNEVEANVKRKMLERAKDITLLADYSKFSKIAHVTVCSIDRINRIITDKGTSPDRIKQFTDKGIEVIVAE